MSSDLKCKSMIMVNDDNNIHMEINNFVNNVESQVVHFDNPVGIVYKSMCCIHDNKEEQYACIFKGVNLNDSEKKDKYELYLNGDIQNKNLDIVGKGIMILFCENKTCNCFAMTFIKNE